MVAVEYNVCIKEVEPLAEGRWADWSHTMMFSFMQAGLVDYLDGENEPPESSTQKQKQEWLAINSRIIGTFGLHIMKPLAQLLRMDMTAAEAWTLLKKKTQADGIMAKLNAMQAAICARFTYSIPTSTTISEIQDLLATVFEGGKPPTHDEWFIVLLLNALKGTDYDWLCSSLIGQFLNAKTTPDEKDIVETIMFARQDHQCKMSKQANIANATKEKTAGRKAKCTNPNCNS